MTRPLRTPFRPRAPWRRGLHLLVALVAFLLASAPAGAHKASDAYLRLHADGPVIDARFDIALRDLDRDLDLDRDADDTLTWREVRTRWPDIAALALRDVAVSGDGVACTGALADGARATPALTTHSDGRYAVLHLAFRCAAPVAALGVDYRLFAKTDPTHRGIVRLVGTDPDSPLATAVLSPGSGVHRFALPQAPIAPTASPRDTGPGPTPLAATPPARAVPPATDDATPSTFPGFVAAGIHHILIGYDHILFLLSLLLPAVWVRRDASGWQPAPAWRPALTGVLKVVTAFTVAHSITLALAVFDVLNPPSRWVESLIAASVVLAALNNLWPVIRDGRWKLTFLFGLVHGFGFASALKDSGLAHGALVSPLVGFNVGVEIGQLAIVALCLPLAWALRTTRTYRGVFSGGSWAIASVAMVWLVQRVFDLQLIAG
jgi:hypothetical protein